MAENRNTELKANSSGTKATDPSNKNTSLTSLYGGTSNLSHSGSRSSSRSSSTSAVLLNIKAKAKAVKAGLLFAQQEAEIRNLQSKKEAEHEYAQAQLRREHQEQKADLVQQMELLAHRKAVAEAEAELSVVEGLCLEQDNLSESPPDPLKTNVDTNKLVENYIKNLPVKRENDTENSLNVDAPCYVPRTSQVLNETSDITRFLLKKELSISRLVTFNDKPESFVVWKYSFKNIMTELHVTPREEVDLLTKYLGPESKKHAISMSVSNMHQPDCGLSKIWDRLEERYGCPEQIERSLRERLNKFPKLSGKDTHRLYELSDLLSEISCIKSDSKYQSVLSYFDSSCGVNPVVTKLPYFIQTKWTEYAIKYKKNNSVLYPSFEVFVDFIRNMSVRYNDPSFTYDNNNNNQNNTSGVKQTHKLQTFTDKYSGNKQDAFLSTKKTDLSNSGNNEKCDCPVHGEGSGHLLKDCRVFLAKTRDEQKSLILKHGMCFKCLSGRHLAKDCKETIANKDEKTSRNHGGEGVASTTKDSEKYPISNKCTQICGEFKGKSCAKTVLVNISKDNKPGNVLQAYAIIDDQSNRSLARSELFEYFKDDSPEESFVLSTCAGNQIISGRKGLGYKVESVNKEYEFLLPGLIECNNIPNVRQEIPTPNVARHYEHLCDISEKIPEYNEKAEVLLLIGRDLLSAHHVLEQRLGGDQEPYAQKLKLGWVIIGESCLGLVHKTDTINVNKTNILSSGRTTCLDLCPNNYSIKSVDLENMVDIGTDIFERKPEDDTPGYSQIEKEFINIMNNDFVKTASGNWSAPLPFVKDRPRLPNNYVQAKNRFDILDRSLRKNSTKQKDFFDFMEKIIENKHAEKAPPLDPETECWYLPIFGIYHNKKHKLRVVFDSAAKHRGLSLNDVLLKGPDLTNNLAGVLLKFRKEKIAITGDIEQMFFNFHVHEKDRDYLRFLWYGDNDINKPVIEYRMRVHVFGNKPSPAVANFGLQKSVCDHQDEKHCDSVCEFVKKHFYVDDGLISLQDEQSAIKLIRDTQARLLENGNIRLHKLSSNSLAVLENLPKDDIVDNIIQDMELNSDITQRSLGLYWKLIPDVFTYKVSEEEKPFTKRGVLSVVNSIYDPLGFVAPVVLGGKLLLRKLVTDKGLDWDDPLPPLMENEWKIWKLSLADLEHVEISRCYSELSVVNSLRRELHVFSDASKEAIGAVAYIKLYGEDNSCTTSFVLGKSKVAPDHGHTIPRLELCGAVLASELAAYIVDNLNVTFDSIHFYTDSQVVLGYIFNKCRKFYVYVGNRVDKILHRTEQDQWSYVPTEENPADLATRKLNAHELSNSNWLSGPTSFLQSREIVITQPFELVDENNDKEIRPETIDVLKTKTLETLNTKRFERFSKWDDLVKAICNLKQMAAKKHGDQRSKVDISVDAENFIITLVQSEFYSKEMDCLMTNKPLNKNSALFNLSPYLDNCGLMRVGGRLKHLKVDLYEKNPIIIPSKHHIALLIVRHFHAKVEHQGRQITEGRIRASGYWIVGGKRLISSVIYNCIRCRIIRGKTLTQVMSDLPADRITPCPPFTYVGVDVFGPWNIVSRRTRGGVAHTKRWAVIFCCMVTRGIHIEVLEDMSTSSFINGLKRFIAIRGPVKQLRSDNGSNFIGAVAELNITAINVEDPPIKDFLNKEGIIWIFNAPHSSHMGGAWERLIGVIRRILDNMLYNINMKNFTQEVLSTLMAEVSAIVNGRPLVPVSDDPDNPSVLTPNMLITQKYNSHVESFDYFTDISVKDMYRSQWRFVQVLAENFWTRWSSEYLQTLQVRQKWQTVQENIKIGDIVLMKDSQVHRNEWPIGIVEKVFPSEDNKVRKVEIRIGSTRKSYVRPITQIVLLLSDS